MRLLHFNTRARAISAAMLAVLLAGCDRNAPVPDVPEPTVAPAAQASSAAPIAATTPDTTLAIPAPPVRAAATAPATAAMEPALSSMKVALGSSKLSVPVELRFQFDGPVRDGQPVTLHLAAVPRVEGSNLAVSIKEVAGLRTTAGELRAQKVTASSPYRRQLSVTKLADGPRELRVLVTMDMPVGSAFGWFSVPFDAQPVAHLELDQKQQ